MAILIPRHLRRVLRQLRTRRVRLAWPCIVIEVRP
jgi:hypothetical protein